MEVVRRFSLPCWFVLGCLAPLRQQPRPTFRAERIRSISAHYIDPKKWSFGFVVLMSFYDSIWRATHPVPSFGFSIAKITTPPTLGANMILGDFPRPKPPFLGTFVKLFWVDRSQCFALEEQSRAVLGGGRAKKHWHRSLTFLIRRSWPCRTISRSRILFSGFTGVLPMMFCFRIDLIFSVYIVICLHVAGRSLARAKQLSSCIILIRPH